MNVSARAIISSGEVTAPVPVALAFVRSIGWPTENTYDPEVTCPSTSLNARHETMYVPSRDSFRDTRSTLGSAGSRVVSLLSATEPSSYSTSILERRGSTGSVNSIVTCAGAMSSTAFAAGSERAMSACAKTTPLIDKASSKARVSERSFMKNLIERMRERGKERIPLSLHPSNPLSLCHVFLRVIAKPMPSIAATATTIPTSTIHTPLGMAGVSAVDALPAAS